MESLQRAHPININRLTWLSVSWKGCKCQTWGFQRSEPPRGKTAYTYVLFLCVLLRNKLIADHISIFPSKRMFHSSLSYTISVPLGSTESCHAAWSWLSSAHHTKHQMVTANLQPLCTCPSRGASLDRTPWSHRAEDGWDRGAEPQPHTRCGACPETRKGPSTSPEVNPSEATPQHHSTEGAGLVWPDLAYNGWESEPLCTGPGRGGLGGLGGRHVWLPQGAVLHRPAQSHKQGCLLMSSVTSDFISVLMSVFQRG